MVIQQEWRALADETPSGFDRWDVVAEPDRDEAEWWAGAPSVCRGAGGEFWLALRMRTADAPLGLRGYEIRLLRSDDGIRFQAVHAIRREDVPIPGFERPALVRDPATGRFRLYGCSPIDGVWQIIRFDDADRPDRFVASSARTVIAPLARTATGPQPPTGYKDPFILHANDGWHCFTIGIQGCERTFHFVSPDGETWQPDGDPCQSLMGLCGWHTHAVRPASIVPLGLGYLFIYEGSDTRWPDPAYCIATGLGYTLDLRRVIDVTPDAPLLVSPTPGRLPVWRYSHWLWVGDELWAYAEVERPNGSHETRLYRLPRR
jgi:hypothetical protein